MMGRSQSDKAHMTGFCHGRLSSIEDIWVKLLTESHLRELISAPEGKREAADGLELLFATVIPADHPTSTSAHDAAAGRSSAGC